MILFLIVLLSVGLFVMSAFEKHRRMSSRYPDASDIIPRLDGMINKNDVCAPPPCGLNEGGFDKRDIGVFLPGCSKVFLENEEKVDDIVESDYYEKFDDEFSKIFIDELEKL